MQEKRLFVALPLPPDVSGKLQIFPQTLQRQEVRWVPAENWHLTVLFLGNVDGEKPGLYIEKLRAAALPSPFRLRLQDKIKVVNRRGRTEMLWAAFEQSLPFARLCYQVAQALDRVPDREPLPHVTLARTRKDFRGRIDAAQFPQVSTIEFPVTAFELWESQLLPQGAIYTSLARFELPLPQEVVS